MTLRSCILIVFFLAFASAQGAEYTETATLDGAERVTIYNIAGRIEIFGAEPGAGRIEWTAHGEDTEALPALTQTASGRTVVFRADYGDDTKSFVYPSAEYRRLNLEARYDGRKVRVRGDGRGVQAWMDMRIYLEPGQDLKYDLLAGPIEAEGVAAELDLRARAGRIRSADGQGDLNADTGSGSIEVFGHRGRVLADTGSGAVIMESVLGDVTADTGSGAIRLRGIDGEVRADTGSGEVDLTEVNSGRVRVDTGSGGVRLDEVSGSLYVDTGSGSVRGRAITAGSDLEIDTGSGSVDLSGDLAGVRHLRIDTGSGSVDLSTSVVPSLRLTVETSNGGIRVDLPEMEMVRSERNRLETTLAGGAGTGIIDTGSGSVTFRHGDAI
jgi:hypothetical protein